MRDGSLRRGAKWLARICYAYDLRRARTLAARSGAPSYVLGGSCQGCGQCCEEPAIQVGRWVWYVPTLRRLFLWWQRVINGFELVGRDRAARLFRFRCSHFDPVTRRCDSYSSRPGMCREYPRGLLDQPHPQLLPGCGYRPIAVNAEGLRDALRRLPLSPEQRGKLDRDLFLDQR